MYLFIILYVKYHQPAINWKKWKL